MTQEVWNIHAQKKGCLLWRRAPEGYDSVTAERGCGGPQGVCGVQRAAVPSTVADLLPPQERMRMPQLQVSPQLMLLIGGSSLSKKMPDFPKNVNSEP